MHWKTPDGAARRRRISVKNLAPAPQIGDIWNYRFGAMDSWFLVGTSPKKCYIRRNAITI